MTSPRLRFAIAAAVVAAAIAGLIVSAIGSSKAYYLTPAELAAQPVSSNQRVRIAGNVVEASIVREGPTTHFTVTDGEADVRVTTEDVVPDTFGAGVEVVAEGAMTERGVFSASTVLTKCPSKFKAELKAGTEGLKDP